MSFLAVSFPVYEFRSHLKLSKCGASVVTPLYPLPIEIRVLFVPVVALDGGLRW